MGDRDFPDPPNLLSGLSYDEGVLPILQKNSSITNYLDMAKLTHNDSRDDFMSKVGSVLNRPLKNQIAAQVICQI